MNEYIAEVWIKTRFDNDFYYYDSVVAEAESAMAALDSLNAGGRETVNEIDSLRARYQLRNLRKL